MMSDKDKRYLECPDCSEKVQRREVKEHVMSCKMYRKKYLNSMNRTIDITSKNNLKFMFAELELVKEKIKEILSDSDQEQNNGINKNSSNLSKNVNASHQSEKTPKANNIQNHKINQDSKKVSDNSAFDRILSKNKNQKQHRDIMIANNSLNLNNKQKIRQKQNEMAFMESLLEEQYFQNGRMKAEEESIECSKCHHRFNMNQVEEFVYADLCLHPICKKCMITYLDKQYVNAKGKYKYPCPHFDCSQQIPYYQLAEIFGQDKMEQIQNLLNSEFMNNLITCSKCKSKFEFLRGKPEDAPKTNDDGKKVDTKYLEEFANNRFLCPNCKTEQCKSCQITPYHFGKTCEQFKFAKTQKKCRYCGNVLPLGYTSANGIAVFDDVCDQDQCYQKTKLACSKLKKCGHSCNGFIKQKQCIPCLKQKCAKINEKQLNGQNEDSYCNICYIEGLGNAPCIKIKCGHIFHFDCLLKRLKTRWFGPRIMFNFCLCPLCKVWIQVPEECQMSKILKPYKQLETELKDKALKRLKFQKDDKNQKLKDPSSEYYKNEQKYAMAIYAYFQCWKCKKPYFGGRKSCADAMNDNREGQNEFKPEDLICPQCCPVSVNNCTKHGKEFISFKCKFCCSIAQWFCWGSTHFCDPCHKRQIEGEYLNKIPKQKLPKCQGPGKCPVGGNHDGNGETKSLGCSLCTNLASPAQNF